MADNYTLVNAYDDLVKEKVKQMISKEEDMCQCEKCFFDVCAIVFNRGYTNFVTTRKGQMLTAIEETSTANLVDLTVKILEAIEIVKKSPNH